MKNSKENKLKGEKAEEIFAKAFSGSIIREATANENKDERWDFLLKGDVRVDAKSKNKYEGFVKIETIRRWEGLQWKYPKDAFPPEQKLGWVYGNADYIAFQLVDSKFEFFKRKDLVKVYEENKNTLEHLNWQQGSQIVKIPRELLPEAQIF